nr:putative reverse transcriptase domain-containing protein [Tanacetum cinerariifolium]
QPPQRQVEFCIDLVHEATPVAKSPYRLEPSKMKELSGQLQSCKTRVSYDLAIHCGEHQCRLLRRGAWCSFEVSVGITEEGKFPKVRRSSKRHARRKATWFISTDGKKKRREFVLYGSNLGSVGRKCNG